MNKLTTLQEKILFLSKFIHAPKQIGSVTPSSKYLAEKMLAPIQWNEARSIAELGAGTGAITKYLYSTKKEGSKILLFEKDTYLRENLSKQYADCSVYEDACQLQTVMRNEGIEQLDCILSGLPFFNFSAVTRSRLLEQILLSLKCGGLFIAFQYSWQMKHQLEQHFDIIKICFVPVNLPPAFVYVCRKK